MQQQSTNAMQDVADAFICRPPSIIDGLSNNSSEDQNYPFGSNEIPPYW